MFKRISFPIDTNLSFNFSFELEFNFDDDEEEEDQLTVRDDEAKVLDDRIKILEDSQKILTIDDDSKPDTFYATYIAIYTQELLDLLKTERLKYSNNQSSQAWLEETSRELDLEIEAEILVYSRWDNENPDAGTDLKRKMSKITAEIKSVTQREREAEELLEKEITDYIAVLEEKALRHGNKPKMSDEIVKIDEMKKVQEEESIEQIHRIQWQVQYLKEKILESKHSLESDRLKFKQAKLLHIIQKRVEEDEIKRQNELIERNNREAIEKQQQELERTQEIKVGKKISLQDINLQFKERQREQLEQFELEKKAKQKIINDEIEARKAQLDQEEREANEALELKIQIEKLEREELEKIAKQRLINNEILARKTLPKQEDNQVEVQSQKDKKREESKRRLRNIPVYDEWNEQSSDSAVVPDTTEDQNTKTGLKFHLKTRSDSVEKFEIDDKISAAQVPQITDEVINKVKQYKAKFDQPALQSKPKLSLSKAQIQDNIRDIIRKLDRFSFDLFDTLAREQDNFLISPYSIALGLLCLLAGARGETLKQLRLKLNSTRLNNDYIQEYGSLMIKHFEATLGKEMTITNKLFVHNFAIVPGFKFDFKGEILRQPKSLKSSANFDNSNYFRAKFGPHKIARGENFYFENDQVLKVDMLNFVETINCYENSEDIDAKICELPIDSAKKISALIILPNENFSIASVQRQLNFDNLTRLLEKKSLKLVNLKLPNISSEKSEFEMSSYLKDMGLELPFDKSIANYTAMTSAEDFWIESFIHRARLDLKEDEDINLDRDINESVEFVCNRPFLFIVRDMVYQKVLFFGKYVKP